MSSLFKMPAMPPPPQLEMPKVADVPSAEDEARRAEEAEDMRRRNRNRKCYFTIRPASNHKRANQF